MSLVAFNVYEPPVGAGDRLDRGERLVFVKDGFHWLAALVPVIWLPVKGLWLELLVFLVGVGVFTWALEMLGVNDELVSTLILIIQIVIGFEATNIQGAALERRGWRMAGAIVGRNREECEVRFLATWLPQQPGTDDDHDPMAPRHHPAPTQWPATAWQNVKDAFARGQRLART